MSARAQRPPSRGRIGRVREQDLPAISLGDPPSVFGQIRRFGQFWQTRRDRWLVRPLERSLSTAFVRDETKLLSVVDRPIPPNLHVFTGDISKSADIARVMVRHDVAINAAGHVTRVPPSLSLYRLWSIRQLQ